MSGVRVLVGTRKGAFVLTSDGNRTRWNVDGPLFGGWEIYHLTGSPADPDRLYASQSGGWFGQVIQRSDDGGTTWQPVGNQFSYDGVPGTHQWYDGTPHPWEFARVWHLEPSLTDPDTVYAGVEDAALFRSDDGGQNWQELPGLRDHDSGPSWQPGAGGMCLHTIVQHPTDPGRMFVAISAAGVFRTDDAGKTWRPTNRGLHSEGLPDPNAEVGHCVHRLALHPSQPDVLFMQKHWDVMRSDDAGESWYEISGDLPTDFGFPIDVHSHEPDTVYVVPIKSDTEHYPPDGKLRVYRSRTGGHEWEPLT
ncbi:MAG TPA: exo-alpha-sialidase, partial [Pseudonocardiaceae bacterium]|nr:exo-alpha-sialidase [Pseudonocardiaceae bacterium]